MAPSEAERDLLFKQFGRAFFKQDMDALYEVVTENFTYSILVNDESRVMRSRDEVAAFFNERNGTQKDVRFEDVVFHHAPEATFMTYRVTGTDLATNARFEKIGWKDIHSTTNESQKRTFTAGPFKRVTKRCWLVHLRPKTILGDGRFFFRY